ncbi:hypothetical protein [Acinetobacter soli]|uniref:hypothetical protein n=1 Tax=Acinetobacter soli TaxID=487316 RepID=UPI00124FFD8B|nr:hypothetical protein [Acinetobacter soli]MEB4802517.1 hypothetical protein [Acinetobacter soli]
MDDEDGYEWCELIFAVALEQFKPSAYEIDNKLRFFALVLKLFIEMRKEQAIIEVKTVFIKFKFRSKSYTFWVFEIPNYEDRKLYLEYLRSQLTKLID